MAHGRLVCSLVLILPLGAVDVGRIQALEAKGAAAEARAVLADAANAAGATAEDRIAFAEFLDRRRDPAVIPAYEAALREVGDPAKVQQIERRLKLLRALASDAGSPASTDEATAFIPGPLRSFNRMAAISADLRSEDILPALARNIVTNGYQASSGNEALVQTEYLKLVVRYLSQARELEKLAGSGQMIRVEECDSTATADLLKVLGYRMRGACGSDVVLETVNASRAFLTIDSGFPLAQLEQSLRINKPFEYDFRPSAVTVLYGEQYWAEARNKGASENFVDQLIADPALCRLYLGLSKLDPETSGELRTNIPVQRLKAFAHVLDFFGGMFEIRDGKAVVPGAPRSVPGWSKLAGKTPDNGAEFLAAVIAKDDGWLASYFDATARIHGKTQEYLTDPQRMERYYTAIRGRITSPGPARPVFRANTDMMLLTTRLRIEPDGRPHIPGSVDNWRTLFQTNPHGKYDGKLTKSAAGWKEPDDVVEALFALSRKAVENEPLKIFLALSDVNRRRSTPLQSSTVDRMMRDFRGYSSQYTIFAEGASVRDETIIQFLDTAAAITSVRDQQMRSEAAGLMQGLTGLWQIFYRQGLIPASEADTVLRTILSSFSKPKDSLNLFDAGRAGVKTLLAATGANADAKPQDRMLDLLSGEKEVTDYEVHTRLLQDMMRIFESQRLVSLDTIFDLADNLESVAKGGKLNTQLVGRLSSRIQEIQPARISLSGAEKNAMAFGYYTEKHIDRQRKVNFRALAEKYGNDPEKLKEARGQLLPFLRDTIVGLNYLHYAPPGAQILFTNPLFVRSHDFIGLQGTNQTWRSTEVFGSGWPSSGGGRLVGSLSHLPYALAEAEQNFLIPTREQALIWGDLVPQMIVSATVPRWWSVTPSQMHIVGLHLRLAESAVAEAALEPDKRPAVLEALAPQVPPARLKLIDRLLVAGNARSAADNVSPAEAMLLASRLLAGGVEVPGPETTEIKRLMAESPEKNGPAAISRAFGTPKPTLASSYSPELLNLRTFPTLMGYSSRILAESWESSTLYYAALADELNLRPSQLNVQVPLWTQKTVEAIFATHLEDWPAVLRSLRVVGENARSETRKQPLDRKASLD